MFAAKRISYQQTGAFTRIITDYLSGSDQLKSFYSHPPNTRGIEAAIEQRKNFPSNRDVLVKVLKEQYQDIETSQKVRSNIDSLLSQDSFTITTAHQPNLFTGPLYLIYKILHAIKLADSLGSNFPQYNFIPVYYLGSEDADFAELNHTYVRGKKLEWQTGQGGAVGRMLTDRNLTSLLQELKGQLGVEPFGNEIVSLMERCYSTGKSIQQATFEFLDEIFRDFGLVILIPDHDDLKRSMIPVFEDDIFHNKAVEIVERTSQRLGEHYNVQAHSRPINLFYLKEHIRERIEKKGEGFQVLNTGISFSPGELKKELLENPGRFSPNVIMRGLYQETILPNLAFIGGGGELAYWMQFKDLFEYYRVPFPVLILRNSFLIIEEKWLNRIHKLGLSEEELFFPENDIMNLIVERQSKNLTSLNGNFEKAEDLFRSIQVQAETIDPSLSQHVAAIRTRSLKTLQELEKKMLRAEKRKFSDQQGQVHKIKEVLFPNKGLQERVENISGFYARWGKSFINELYQHSLALEQEFVVLKESAGS
ncbi:MAG TPA: bacillithiol biosynthesis cysteine-adding enzyme BshC [Flavisolibacter sp.]